MVLCARQWKTTQTHGKIGKTTTTPKKLHIFLLSFLSSTTENIFSNQKMCERVCACVYMCVCVNVYAFMLGQKKRKENGKTHEKQNKTAFLLHTHTITTIKLSWRKMLLLSVLVWVYVYICVYVCVLCVMKNESFFLFRFATRKGKVLYFCSFLLLSAFFLELFFIHRSKLSLSNFPRVVFCSVCVSFSSFLFVGGGGWGKSSFF